MMKLWICEKKDEGEEDEREMSFNGIDDKKNIYDVYYSLKKN